MFCFVSKLILGLVEAYVEFFFDLSHPRDSHSNVNTNIFILLSLTNKSDMNLFDH